MKISEEKFQREANRLARSYSPDIKECAECGYPVIKGYCCTYCGNTDPSTTFVQQKATENLHKLIIKLPN